MYSSLQGDISAFDFDEFAGHLLEQGLQASPAELHGCLCGLLAGGAASQAEVGLAAVNQALELDLHGELAHQVMQLYISTAASLRDEEFNFYPLLPDDDVEIAVRTAALAGWCESFLVGYAQAGTARDRQPEALPGDSSEILADFAAIAEAEVDASEDEEESERSYAELIEYVRFAAINVFTDTGAEALAEEPSPEESGPRH